MEALTKAVRDTMNAMLDDIVKETLNRGKSATGSLINSNRATVLAGNTYVIAEGRAAEHWKYAGNGRGPGKMPPTRALHPWLRAKGIDIRAAFPIARKMAKEGSEDYRKRGTNIYTDVITRYREGNKFDFTEQATKAITEMVVQDFTKLEKAA